MYDKLGYNHAHELRPITRADVDKVKSKGGTVSYFGSPNCEPCLVPGLFSSNFLPPEISGDIIQTLGCWILNDSILFPGFSYIFELDIGNVV